MMMSGSGASTCAAACGRAATSRIVNRPFNCGLLSSSSLGSPLARARLINAPHRNAPLAIPSHLVGVIAGVMVLSEVVKRLMMMSGSDASSYAAECGQATSSRFIEVVATTVPAGHRQLGGPSQEPSIADQAVFCWPHSNEVPSTQIQWRITAIFLAI
jgi:hypothetical protein